MARWRCCFPLKSRTACGGRNFHAAWCDELAKWRYDEATWDMLQFGLRLGQHPQQIVTTTPRPTALIRRLMADKSALS
jgi:phage terminase large subunit-like protein